MLTGFAVIAAIATIVGLGFYFSGKEEDKIIFFYSLTCPHCKVVEEYMAANNTEAKIKMAKKEISESKANADELVRKSAACGIEPEEMGVPLLWNEGKCLVGDKDIINYFKEIDGNE